MLIFTSGTSGDPKAVRCTHEKVAFPGDHARGAVRAGPGRHLLPVDAAVPLERDHGGLGSGGGGGRLDRVAAQVLRVAVLSRRPALRRDLRELRRQAAVLHPGHRPAADDADNPLRIAYGNEGAPRDLDRFAQRFGVHGGRRVRLQRGRGVDRAHPGHPGRRARARWSTASRSSTSTPGAECPPGVVGELVNTDGPGQFRGYYKDGRPRPSGWRGGVYHSGDLAYRDENGFAYFAGRLGDWMRVDGENLGTAPIERILMRYPDVTEVAVYPIPDPAVGDQVMAALVLPDGHRVRPGRVPRIPHRAARSRSQAVAGRSFGSAPPCPAPRRSRSSSGSCPPKAPTAPIRCTRSRVRHGRCARLTMRDDIATMLLDRLGDEHTGLRTRERDWTWDEVVRESAARGALASALRTDGSIPHRRTARQRARFRLLAGRCGLGRGDHRRASTRPAAPPTWRPTSAHADCQLIVTDTAAHAAAA